MSAARSRMVGMAVAAVCSCACQGEAPSTIQLRVGNAPDQQRSFAPRVALAEYLDLPETRAELRLTLADYDVPCDRFVAPAVDQTYISVLIVTPPGTEPSPGTFAWGGPDAHGGTPSHPDRPFAMPKAYLGHDSHLFPPGGSVRLTHATLERDGYVEGVLDFQFAGDATRQAASLQGNFRARICKTSR